MQIYKTGLTVLYSYREQVDSFRGQVDVMGEARIGSIPEKGVKHDLHPEVVLDRCLSRLCNSRALLAFASDRTACRTMTQCFHMFYVQWMIVMFAKLTNVCAEAR